MILLVSLASSRVLAKRDESFGLRALFAGMYQDWNLIQLETAREEEEKAEKAARADAEQPACEAAARRRAASESEEEEEEQEEEEASQPTLDASSQRRHTAAALHSPASSARLPRVGDRLLVAYDGGTSLADATGELVIVLAVRVQDPPESKKRKKKKKKAAADETLDLLLRFPHLAADFQMIEAGTPLPEDQQATTYWRITLAKHGTQWDFAPASDENSQNDANLASPP